MSQDEGFVGLLALLRAGDNQAVGRLINLCQREVRRAAHPLVVALGLGRLYDWEDAFQDVLRRFAEKATRGGFPRLTEQGVVGLLVTMTRNRIKSLARHHRAELRHHVVPMTDVAEDAGDRSAVEERQERLRSAWAKMNEAERYVTVGRASGKSWDVLGEECCQSPEALRKQQARMGVRLRKLWAVEAE